MTEPTGRERPAAFLRRYTRTWVHALATAALTAFGTLTVLDSRFAAVAIAVYVVPPVVLYLRGGAGGEPPAGDTTGTATDMRSEPESGSGVEFEFESEPGGTPGWTAVPVPVEDTLRDVVIADTGTYAVGDGGTVLVDDGDGWATLLRDGPRAESNALRGVDAAGSGAVWVAGDGGTVARIDPETGRHVDHSEPDGDTTNLVDVAAAGDGGPAGETVLVGDGSGRVRRAEYRDGKTVWTGPVTPGSGSSLAGLAMRNPSVGWVCDTSQRVFETTDGGRTFTRTGVDGGSGTMTDAAATGSATALATDDGVVYRDDGGSWTPVRVADTALLALAGRGERWLACGDGGTVVERRNPQGPNRDRSA